MMRILRLCLDVPYPPTDGVRIEPFYTIRELAGRGHQITLVAFRWGDDRPVATLEQYCELHAFPFRGRNTLVHLVRGTLESFPVNYMKYRNERFFEKCQELLRQRSFDVLVVDYSALGWYALELSERARIPLITRWHNLDAMIWQRWAEAQWNPIKRALGFWQLRLISGFERSLALASDLCLMTGARDAAVLEDLVPGARVRFLPAGVDTEHYAPDPREPIEPGSILYLASGYQWHANQDSARRLYEEIMPAVWQSQPGAKLYITGKDPPAKMKRWAASDRVVLTGFLFDDREVLRKANVVTVPMRLGGGIKLKVLTALSMGKAVVTSTQGAEGISGLVDGEHVLVRDDPEDFADAVLELIRNPGRCVSLGTNGRALMQRDYDWKVIGSQWEQAVQNVVQQRETVHALR